MTVLTAVLAWVLAAVVTVLAALAVRRAGSSRDRVGVAAVAVLAIVVAGLASYDPAPEDDTYSQEDLRSIAFDVSRALEDPGYGGSDEVSLPMLEDVEGLVEAAGGDLDRATVLRVAPPLDTLTPGRRFRIVSGDGVAQVCVEVRPSSVADELLATVPGDVC